MQNGKFFKHTDVDALSFFNDKIDNNFSNTLL